MGSITNTGGSKVFVNDGDKTICRKKRCLHRGKTECKYCGNLFCEEHIAPYPDEYRRSFGNQGHNCDNFPKNKNPEKIIKEYPSNVSYSPEEFESDEDIETNQEESYESDELEDLPVNKYTKHKPKVNRKKKSMLFWGIIMIVLTIVILSGLYLKDLFNKTELSSEDSATSEYIFSQLNLFRQSNNIQTLENSNDAKDMALFLSSQYILGNRSFGESAIKQIESKFGLKNTALLVYEFNQSKGYTADYILSRWQDLGSWKESLLNSSYKSGSVICHKIVCYGVLLTNSNLSLSVIVTEEDLSMWQKFTNWLSSKWSGNDLNSPSPTENKIKDKNSGLGNFISGIFDPKSQIDISELEQEVHNLINSERTNNGLRPLSWDDNIVTIAREHSKDMVDRNFFAHVNPNGEDPTERAKRHGYSCVKDYGSYYTYGLAENIAETPIYSDVIGCGSTTSLDSLAKCIVDGWMGSPGHRENILTSTYTKTGIGIAYSDDDKAYSTQDFC
jgi:uncharacterized protein YkwD